MNEAKKDGLNTTVDKKNYTLNDAESLLKGLRSKEMVGSEFKERYNNIANNANTIANSKVTRNDRNFSTVK